jgi:NTE family protein
VGCALGPTSVQQPGGSATGRDGAPASAPEAWAALRARAVRWRRRLAGPDAQDRDGRERHVFVLSGGANRGVLQVGMLRAVLERGIVPDVVIGCSAGAMNGAWVCAHPHAGAIDELAAIWASLRSDVIFPGGTLARTWNVIRRGNHLVPNTGMASLVARTAAPTFADLTVPLRVVATDFGTGEEVVFASGPLPPALLASASLPGLFPPVEHAGRVLVDGAVVDTVPLSHALAGPPATIWIFDVSGAIQPRTIRNPLDSVMHAFAISRKQRYLIERDQAPAHFDIVELPVAHDDRSIFDMAGAETLVDEAHAVAARFLDQREHVVSLRKPRRH